MFRTIEDVIDYSNELDLSKHDQKFSTESIVIVDADTIAIDNVVYPLNRFLIQQLFNRMTLHSKTDEFKFGTIVINYLMNNPEIRGMNLTHSINKFMSKYPNVKWLGRFNYDKMRALLSDGYSVLNNSTAIKYLSENVLSSLDNVRILRDTFVGEDNIALKVMIEEFDNDGLGIGFAVLNNELGTGSIAFKGLVKRAQCDNSIITSGSKRFYHRGNVYDRIEVALPQIKLQLENAKLLRNQFHIAEQKVINNMDILIPSFCLKHNLSKKIEEQMFVGTENSDTVMGFINGITHAAKTLDATERTSYEELAGDLIWLTPEQLMNEYIV